MSIIYLVRHGQASFGAANYDQLSPLGVRQAQVAAHCLANQGIVFDGIYSGAMERQKDTAQALARAYESKGEALPELAVNADFDEYDSYGVLTAHVSAMVQEDPSLGPLVEKMQSDRKAFQLVFEKAMQRWASGKHPVPGLASWADFTARVNRGLESIMAAHGSGKNVAVFTSGGPVSVAVQKALFLSAERAMEVSWQIMNASITRLKYSGTKVILYTFNEVAHLERENDRKIMTYR